MKTILGALIGSGLLLGACVIKSGDETSRFSEPIPQGSDVALAIPGSGASATGAKAAGGLHIASNPPTTGGYAAWYQFTRDVSDAVDLGTGYLLGVLWLIVHTPPSSVAPHEAVWGPGSASALDPLEWRLTVTEIGDREYDYVLDARQKATGGAFRAIMKGHGFGATRPEHRSGTFTLDHDAYRELDPMRGHDNGTTRVTFDLRAFPATIEADVRHSVDAERYDVKVTHQADRSGAVDVTALGDIDAPKDGKLENVVLHSRWNPTGAGRADVQITGGSTTTNVQGSECWGTSFTRTYYTDNVNWRPTEGDAASCVFPAASF